VKGEVENIKKVVFKNFSFLYVGHSKTPIRFFNGRSGYFKIEFYECLNMWQIVILQLFLMYAN
jgi:hypothetical protein